MATLAGDDTVPRAVPARACKVAIVTGNTKPAAILTQANRTTAAMSDDVNATTA